MYVARIMMWIGMSIAFVGVYLGISHNDYLAAVINALLGAWNNKGLIVHKREFGD